MEHSKELQSLGLLLDVACGAGTFAAELAQDPGGVTEIVAVDTQASALEAAARTLADLPHTLHHLPDPGTVIP